jgi:catechol 2,3-dioxygenase-like lactoylglutathione lyase family enzyme
MGIKASILLLTALLAVPAPQPSPALAGIAHVALRVADLQKSREFYQNLGFEQAFEFADPGKAPVSYMKVNDRQFIELYQRSDDSQLLGLMHVCYEAGDIDALQDFYVQRGLSAPVAKKARAGNLLFSLHDPEDQTLEFTQYMPGSLHFEDRGKHLGEHRISQHMLRATIPVKEPAEEQLFYTSKLGFEETKGGDAVRLRIPGASGDEIELKAESSSTKPRITFAVTSVEKAAGDLRSRGVSFRKGEGISLTDPDGAVITFTENENGKR